MEPLVSNDNASGTGTTDAGTAADLSGAQQGSTQATGAVAAAPGSANATVLAADTLNQSQAKLGEALQPGDQSSPTGEPASDASEQLTLLRKIDSDVGLLAAKLDGIETRAMRNGAIAGGVAGGIAGGVVATGLRFIRAHLGL